MNLVIDVGNTHTKVAVFDSEKVVSIHKLDQFSLKGIKALVIKHPAIKRVILSSVIGYDKSSVRFLKGKYELIELSHTTRIPIKNKYSTQSTLGKDRLACAVGSNARFRNKNVLCIDAGTCIKYDFVNSKNEYLGGAISPGIDMRFKALEHFTDKLPLISYTHFNKLIGNSTRESILSGVVVAAGEEIKGFVAQYKKKHPNLKVILTGGNLEFLQGIFNIAGNKNSSIFADPCLLLKGLNYILNYNI